MRLFIAISFEEDIVEQIAEVQRRLCEALETGVPVPTENMHLTLVFLGEIDEDDLVAVEDVLDDVQSRLNFDLVFDRVDTFGSHGKSPDSTTWWLGAQPSKQLDHLQKEIADKMARLGVELERRAFVPHVTLVRHASSRAREDAEQTMQELAEKLSAHPITARVNAYCLMESQLTPEGARYQQICSWE